MDQQNNYQVNHNNNNNNEGRPPNQPPGEVDISEAPSLNSVPEIHPREYYSEEAQRPDTRTWEIYRRSWDYRIHETIGYTQRYLQEQTETDTSLIGVPLIHPIPESIRFRAEDHYYFLREQGNNNTNYQRPVSTTITFYPSGYPAFEFLDHRTGTTTISAFPNARNRRLTHDQRLILQALQLSFQDQDPGDFESYIRGEFEDS